MRFGCNKAITVYVPTRYSFKEHPTRCGSTAHDGGVNQCEECAAKLNVPIPMDDEGDMEWFERVSLAAECNDE